MKCPKCNENEMIVVANVTVTAPSQFYQKLTKTSFRNKDVEIKSVDWDRADLICPKCGTIKAGSKDTFESLKKDKSKLENSIKCIHGELAKAFSRAPIMHRFGLKTALSIVEHYIESSDN